MERNIKLLAWVNFFTDLIFFAPVGIIYFSKIVGSYALGMSLFSLMMISASLFELPTGIFSDKIGRKNTVILGSAAGLIAFIFYAVGHNYMVLALGAIIEGIMRSFYSGNNDAFLHNILSQSKQQHKYHEYLGKVSSTTQIALALAAVIGSFIANYSFALLMWISVIPKVFCLIVSFLLTEPEHPNHGRTNIYQHMGKALVAFRDNRKLRLITIAATIRYALGEAGYEFRAVFVNTLWPLWAVGFSNFLSNIGGAFSFYISGKTIDRFSPRVVLWFEIVSNRIVNLISLLFPTVVSPALMGSTSITFGPGTVAVNMLLQQEFSADERATMGSLTSLFGSLGLAVTGFFIGYIADIYGPVKALLVIQILLFIPLWFYNRIFKITS